MMYLLVLSLATLGVSMNYTDYLARNISLPLSAALYSRNSSKCLQKRLKTSEEISVNVKGGSCSGLIAILPQPPTVALAFNANISEPSNFTDFKELFFPLVEWQHEGNVSSFLKQAFEELWIEGGMNGSFQQIMKEQRDKEILITGHSFGGGLAALIAYDIAKKELVKKDKVTLITLGQSMVGDEDFAKAYEEQVKHSFRVVRRGDSIPHVPGRNKSYEYNGREVFYIKRGMKSDEFKICEQDECSGNQTNPIRAINNDKYLGKNVTEYGMKCK
ncbi:triacylglycerol lipase [Ancylostoma ceylanicum]|uniref:Triacylglycerol lipase n=1 Tax=Ancylostoma ceylanicum TaxID=53326 RepID=A0A0D6M1J1_9BILA|nr:triacylglycerol lipase [Ancylostoma ceylanicum]